MLAKFLCRCIVNRQFVNEYRAFHLRYLFRVKAEPLRVVYEPLLVLGCFFGLTVIQLAQYLRPIVALYHFVTFVHARCAFYIRIAVARYLFGVEMV